MTADNLGSEQIICRRQEYKTFTLPMLVIQVSRKSLAYSPPNQYKQLVIIVVLLFLIVLDLVVARSGDVVLHVFTRDVIDVVLSGHQQDVEA
jgi:hypothetical protein